MRTVLLVSLFLFVTSGLFSQEYNIPSSSSERIVKGDSIFCFEVLIEGTTDDVESLKDYYWFKQGQIHINQGGYSGYLLDGSYKIFNKGGKLLEEGFFEEGLKSGVWKRWTVEGRLVYEQRWKRGLKHGSQTFYLKEGITKVEHFKGGRMTGEAKRYRDGKEIRKPKVQKARKEKREKIKKEKSKDSEKLKKDKRLFGFLKGKQKSIKTDSSLEEKTTTTSR